MNRSLTAPLYSQRFLFEGASPAKQIVFLAWSHWDNELIRRDSDRAAILGRLKQLQPSLADPENKPSCQFLVDALAASFRPSSARPGSIEALIDDLRDMDVRFSQDPGEDPRYRRLQSRGFVGIPALIDHLDVLVGEVWLCSGQSNMQKPLGEQRGQRPTLNYEQELRESDYPQIRLPRVPRGRDALENARDF